MRYQFTLTIAPEELARYYRGAARRVVVRSHSGQRVQFDASLLRPYVARDGISGLFEIESDPRGKLIAFRRLARTIHE